MIRSFMVGLLLLGGVARGLADPSPIYVNDTATSVTNVDVDATIFLNRGYFVTDGLQFDSDSLWQPSNTRFYTNSGVMSGTPGFHFDTVGYDGLTNPASVFLNTRTGSIIANDSDLFGGITFGGGVFAGGLLGLDTSSRIEIFADSITNQGLIQAGASGRIQISGQNVDLSGSGVIIEPLSESGLNSGFFTGFSGFGNSILTGGPFNGFIPEMGIYDLAWGISSDTNMFPGSIIRSVSPVNAISPSFQVTNALSGFRGGGIFGSSSCFAQLNLQNAASFVLIRDSTTDPGLFTDTNVTVQVVIVKTSDTNLVPQVNFFDVGGQFLPAVVQFDAPATNIFTRQQITNSLFLVDELPTVSPTNFTLLQNLGAQAFGLQNGDIPTFKPVNFTLSRISPFAFGFQPFLVPTNSVLFANLLSDGSYSNQVVTNIYAGYAAQVDSTTARLPALPGVSVSDLPGRVEITAGDLNLNRTRVRGEGLVSITASNFLGSPRALVDSQQLDFNLASPHQDLTVTNLAPESVQRLQGPITAYSAVWTNLTGFLSTVVDTNTLTNIVVTNVVEIKFHLLMVDASGLSTIQPVTVHHLNLRSSTGIDLQDNLFVGDSLRLEATNVTVRGRLVLDQTVPLDASSLIGIKNLTNYGVINLATLASFGGTTTSDLTDTSGRLGSLVNRGAIQSLGTLIQADYFENTGTITSTNNSRVLTTNDFCLLTVEAFTNAASSIGAIDVNAFISKLGGGSLGTEGDVRFRGGTAKFNNQTVVAGGGLYFNLTNVLTDTGSEAANLWRTGDGIHMDEIPINRGNLFGTRIIASAPEFAIIHSTWGATDFGPTPAGFTNNLAIGQLILDGAFAAQFEFSGAGARKALYIDRLEFRGDISTDLASLEDALVINNLEIYYADIATEVSGAAVGGPRFKRLGPKDADFGSPSSDITPEALDQDAPTGIPHLHWVKDFAGPNSSVDVVEFINGQAVSVSVNRALRYSKLIDSDNDGIPNFYDEFPFSPSMPQISNITVGSSSGQANITFNAQPGGTYQVEASDTLTPGNWQLISTFQNTGSQAISHTVTDPNSNRQGTRFYRVTFNP